MSLYLGPMVAPATWIEPDPSPPGARDSWSKVWAVPRVRISLPRPNLLRTEREIVGWWRPRPKKHKRGTER